MSETHEILILGANFGGISVAHYLLNNTIPSLTSLDSSKAYHVTLVGPSESFLFKISFPRVIASPELIGLDKVVLPFKEGFAKHPDSVFTFVQGLATAVDPVSKTVAVTLHDKSTKSLPYNTLVIATGTTAHPLWSVNDDLTATYAAMAELHAALPTAKTVLIAGAGPVGVEIAGEIADKYKSAKVTIMSGSTRVLPRLFPTTSARAQNMLKKHGVEVINDNIRVVSTTTTTSSSADKSSTTTVNLSDGSQRVVDVYIAATGGTPNTGFLPPSWLDENRRLAVDYESLRATSPDAAGLVYGIGDAASYSLGTLIDLSNGVAPVCTSIGHDLAQLLAAPGAREKSAKMPALREKKYKPFKDTQLVPIGRKSGVGQIKGIRAPSSFVWLMKGRTYFVEKARPSMLGLDYTKP